MNNKILSNDSPVARCTSGITLDVSRYFLPCFYSDKKYRILIAVPPQQIGAKSYFETRALGLLKT